MKLNKHTFEVSLTFDQPVSETHALRAARENIPREADATLYETEQAGWECAHIEVKKAAQPNAGKTIGTLQLETACKLAVEAFEAVYTNGFCDDAKAKYAIAKCREALTS